MTVTSVERAAVLPFTSGGVRIPGAPYTTVTVHSSHICPAPETNIRHACPFRVRLLRRAHEVHRGEDPHRARTLGASRDLPGGQCTSRRARRSGGRFHRPPRPCG